MQNKIKYYRLEKGYKLIELAKLTGISCGYLSHLEHGNRKNPTYKVMTNIAIALDKEITDIFLS